MTGDERERQRNAADGMLLRSAGLRRTVSRLAVINVLRDAARPLSHAEVSGILAGRAFDPVTVYRNLIDLSDAGIAARLDFGDHVWRFELGGKLSGEKGEHPHFLCQRCGHVTCLPRQTVHLRASGAAPRALARGAVTVRVQGLCDECLNRQE